MRRVQRQLTSSGAHCVCVQEMLDFAAAKGIKPMVEVMPLSKINEAFDRVASGKARYRVVLETDMW
jgi:uncharacterized zinc-type alcohol dehydrogenase-like protein